MVSVDLTTVSTKNSTCVTPTLSDASADRVVFPDTVVSCNGSVRDTMGAVVSDPGMGEGLGEGEGVGVGVGVGEGLLTITKTGVEITVLSAASRATAVKVCEPLDERVVFQDVE